MSKSKSQSRSNNPERSAEGHSAQSDTSFQEQAMHPSMMGHAMVYPPPIHYHTPAPGFNPSLVLLQILISIGGSVLAVFLLAGQLFKHTGTKEGVAGKPGTNCSIKQVTYDPAGNAVVSFRCGDQEKDVTVARGAKGDSCSMKTERTHGTTNLVFQCGTQITTVSLPQAGGSQPVGVGTSPTQPQPPVVRTPEPTRPEPRKVAQPSQHKHDHDHAHPHPHPHEARGTSHAGKSTGSVDTVAVGDASFSIKDAPGLGNKHAKVKVIVFSDFQCPFCSRGVKLVDEMRTTYKENIYVAFKHLPLSFHQDAHLAAQASMAAHEQGKFWAYHDKLFANQNNLKKDDLLQYAKDLKLDVDKFKQALESKKYAKLVDEDAEDAKRIGANGTPTFIVNGEKIMGALPFSQFRSRIDKILGITDRGSDRNDSDSNNTAPKKQGGNVLPGSGEYTDVSSVALEGSPTWGAAEAKIKILVFSDFECPFCSRGSRSIQVLQQQYGQKDIQIIFKHLPLAMHPNAHLAAQASMAANEQGKFWEYHDKLFANQERLKKDDLLAYARQLGLDMKRFSDALDNGKYKTLVDRDARDAQGLSLQGTPIFYINGYKIPGALPVTYFQDVITALQRGKKPSPFVIPSQPSSEPKDRVEIPVKDDDPSFGNKNAPVTIVEFSDFECSYCTKGVSLMRSVKKFYGDKVRVVFKNQPLDFHPNAHLAAQAALAAHAQGKFWEYHDKLFANTKNLGQPTYLRIAKEVGLDIDRFEREMRAGKYREAVDEDRKLANKVGATSTPIFYINGYPLLGAQPFFRFRLAIDAMLAGKPMPDLSPSPPKNPQRIDILTNPNDPSFGPADAKVTVIEFSDFECGFCKDVSATVKRLKQEYGGKIRFIFKHLPIEFHKSAHLAAQASMAAHEQGKFWEYHDLLFANQRNLTKADLLRYAQQLQLDMTRFRQALDSGKYKDQVSHDYDQGRWWGIDGTPIFIVNGKKMQGAIRYEVFKKTFDDLLSRK